MVLFSKFLHNLSQWVESSNKLFPCPCPHKNSQKNLHVVLKSTIYLKFATPQATQVFVQVERLFYISYFTFPQFRPLSWFKWHDFLCHGIHEHTKEKFIRFLGKKNTSSFSSVSPMLLVKMWNTNKYLHVYNTKIVSTTIFFICSNFIFMLFI